MPQFQLLPEAPSFGSQLGQALGGGISQGLSASLNSYLENKKKQGQFQQLMQAFNLSEGMAGEGTEQVPSSDNRAYAAAAAAEQLGFPQIAAGFLSEAKDKRKVQLEEQKVEKEKERAREDIRPASTKLRAMVKSLGAQPGNQEMSEELDRLGFWYTDKVYTHFNKGVMSNAKFSEVKDTLSPNSKETPRVNIARLNALDTISGLSPNISPKDLDKVIDREVKKVEKIQKAESKMSSSVSTGFVQMIDPSGVIRSIPKSQVKAAEAAGGKLVQ